MDDRLNKLIKKITQSFEEKLSEIISVCDSPIEQLMFSYHVYNFAFDENFKDWYTGDIRFITDDFQSYVPEYNKGDYTVQMLDAIQRKFILYHKDI